MRKAFLLILLLAGCGLGSLSPIYEQCTILINCPDRSSYYYFQFNKDGKGYMGFCFQQGDSVMRTGTLDLSKEDMKHIDSLLLTSEPLSNGGKRPPRDAFSFVLKIDGVNRIEANYSNVSIDAILKVLMPYFPKEKREYDFWEFFKTKEEAALRDTLINGQHLKEVSVYNNAFTINLPDGVEGSEEPHGDYTRYIGFFNNKDSTLIMKVDINDDTSKTRLDIAVDGNIKRLQFIDGTRAVLEKRLFKRSGREMITILCESPISKYGPGTIIGSHIFHVNDGLVRADIMCNFSKQEDRAPSIELVKEIGSSIKVQ